MAEEKVLVVDDDPFILRMLTLLLRREGYHVLQAMDGEEALAQIRASKPMVVLLDAVMPKKDGYQVCQEVRSDPTITPQPYIIMLTAQDLEDEQAKATQLGVSEYIAKPFNPTRVVARVREVLRGERGRKKSSGKG